MAIAKRKLKAPSEPILRKSASENALMEAKLELATLKDRHKLAIVAQRDNELSAGAISKRDPGLAIEKRKLEYKIARAADETEVLAQQARAERAKTPDAATAAKSAHRRRALSVLALRAANREIEQLRKDGIVGPVDLAYQPGGLVPWTALLLSGWLGRSYLQACADAFLITSAELRDDDD
jgi:hypothetical protein